MNLPAAALSATPRAQSRRGKRPSSIRPRLPRLRRRLGVMIGLFFMTVTSLSKVSLDVQRDRNVLFPARRAVENIENVYIIRVFNKAAEEATLNLTARGARSWKMNLPDTALTVEANGHLQLPVNVALIPPFWKSTNMPVQFPGSPLKDDAQVTTCRESLSWPHSQVTT